jgi:hypothetical protein
MPSDWFKRRQRRRFLQDVALIFALSAISLASAYDVLDRTGTIAACAVLVVLWV